MIIVNGELKLKIFITLIVLIMGGYFLYNQNSTSAVKHPYRFVENGGIITRNILYMDIVRHVSRTCNDINIIGIMNLTSEQCFYQFENKSAYCKTKVKGLIPDTIESVAEFTKFSDVAIECILSAD